MVIVPQPEKEWGSIGGRPDEAQLIKDICEIHGRERVAAVCERTFGPAIDCRAPSAHDVEAREPLQYVRESGNGTEGERKRKNPKEGNDGKRRRREQRSRTTSGCQKKRGEGKQTNVMRGEKSN